jgi:hypothetical protein
MDLDDLQAVLTSMVMYSAALALQINFNCKKQSKEFNCKNSVETSSMLLAV